MKLIRVFFEKRDRAKYISHLDLTRCMTRAFARKIGRASCRERV